MTWKELQPCLLPASASQPSGKAMQGKARRKLQPAAGLGKPLTKAASASGPTSNKAPLATGVTNNSKGNATLNISAAPLAGSAARNSKLPLPQAVVTSSRAPAKAAVKGSKGAGGGTAKHIRGSLMHEREGCEEEQAELANEGLRHDTPAMARVAAGRATGSATQVPSR